MPHLQFEINKCVNNVTKQKFVIFIEKAFQELCKPEQIILQFLLENMKKKI